MTAGNQLPALKAYCPKMKEACTQALKAILEEENLPKDPEGLLEKMFWVPQYFAWWKQLSARASINRVLGFVKAHHPNIDLPVITSGLPELKADGTPLRKRVPHHLEVVAWLVHFSCEQAEVGQVLISMRPQQPADAAAEGDECIEDTIGGDSDGNRVIPP
jgi:hypothetical protein